jgi:hypothetical protein
LNEGNNKVKAVGQRNGKTYTDTVIWMYEKNLILNAMIYFFRWFIKIFVVLLLAVAFWMVRLLVKKQVQVSKESLCNCNTCFGNTVSVGNSGRTNSWSWPGHKLF